MHSRTVIAIGSGFFDGLGYSESTKSAFVSQAAKEMSMLAVEMGSNIKTYSLGGYSFLGDLLTTCFGSSRNRYFGELVGKGVPVDMALKVLESMRKHAEGYHSTLAFWNISKKKKMNLPSLNMVKAILFDKKPVKEQVQLIWKPKPSL